MGGRGKVSVTGGTIHIGSLQGGANDIKNVGGDTDPRNDIHVMFEDELGFSDVRGMEGSPTAVLGAQGIQLNNLERQYGAIGEFDGQMEVLGMDSASAIAAVRSNALTGEPNALLLNRGDFKDIKSRVAAERAAEASGWSMPTDGSTTALARYTVTHEYGHIMEAALYKRAKANNPGLTEGRHAASVARDIIKIAQERYGATGEHLSRYGAYNSYEFFAECFANANSGKPNPLGRAMNDYLAENKLRG